MSPETRARVRALISEFMERWIGSAIPAAELERIAREGVSPSGLLTPFHDAVMVTGVVAVAALVGMLNDSVGLPAAMVTVAGRGTSD